MEAVVTGEFTQGSDWQANKPGHPHQVAFDLGGALQLTSFRYLPRPGTGGQGGRIKRYRAFLSKELFPGL